MHHMFDIFMRSGKKETQSGTKGTRRGKERMKWKGTKEEKKEKKETD